ncbi:YjgN family protein [Desulfovibrio mangrovi]|uniref:YjgN family protein n=1 Tax=Desulfovibrio mangrovi TaxID=2976983 RepID=UPI0022473402|nr:YjgN family protein [Desulfovibrio mangrovi]UZP66417.1 YjgN family protein [Desulfovibrio mangrovi]
MELQNDDVLYAGGASNGQGMPQAAPVQSGGFIFNGGTQEGYRQMVQFTGSGWELFKIWIVNFLLTILTLGIYHFWAKVRVRKYLWAHTVVEGEPLEYTGTGKELFFGFLIVVGVFILYMVAQVLLERIHPGLSALAVLVLMPFWFFATYRAIRYRLTRTRWRGIRFNLSGSAWKYMFVAMGQALLNLITLMLWYPKSRAVISNRIVNNMWYGKRRFWFTGKAKPLYISFLVAVLGVAAFGAAGFILSDLPAALSLLNGNPGEDAAKAFGKAMLVFYGMVFLGSMFSYWFFGVYIRWQVANTRFPDIRLRSVVTGRGLLWLQLSNLLLLICTLGLATPWLVTRAMRYYLNTMEVEGSLDYVHLEQDAQEAPIYGEGFFEAFDVDLAV